MNDKSVIVAVDGPSASGKSTVSKRAAQELGYVYVDSGSLYRGITWKAIRDGIDVTAPEEVIALVHRIACDYVVEHRVVRFTYDEEDPGRHIRSAPVRDKVADVAIIPEVRSFIVDRLREMVRFGDIVMEGRDIGSVVFPDTPHKFYLDADPEERARRRYQELVTIEGQSDVNDVMHSLTRRDTMDTTRKTAPLQIALGAQVINTTRLSIEEVVRVIVDTVRAGSDPP